MHYIALLRGINVGGHQVKMERLRELFAELGYSSVRTYIQSGNVFFEAAEDNRAVMKQAIEQHLQQALGYAVPTCLRTIAELERIFALDPFKDKTVTSDMRLCIAFATSPLPSGLALPLWSPKQDMEIVGATETDAFIVWYIINGKPPASDKFLAQTLGSSVTMRFYHTTAKLLEAAKKS